MQLKEAILRKQAGQAEVDAVMKTYAENNPDQAVRMDRHRIKAYQDNVKREAQRTAALARTTDPAKRAKLQNALDTNKQNIAKFEYERDLRRKNNLNVKSIEQQRANAEEDKNVFGKAFTEKIGQKAGEVRTNLTKEQRAEAEQAGLAAVKAHNEARFGLLSDADAAKQEAYGHYMLGGGQDQRMKIKDPKLRTRLNAAGLSSHLSDPANAEALERYNKGVAGHADTGMAWANWAAAAPMVRLLGGGGMADAGMKRAHEGQIGFANRHATAQRDIDAKFKQGYADETKDTVAKFNQGRRDAIGGFFKNNWGKMAGLGMGAMGLMMLGRMGRGGGQQGGYGQPAQKPQKDWTANSNYGRGAYQRAGTTQQTTQQAPNTSTNMFTNFMNKVTT